MSDPDRFKFIVQEWVLKAEHDLITAVHTLELEDECPTDTVCFHAQQCIEKYMKAFLVSQQRDVPRTHDISQLMKLMPESLHDVLSLEEQQRMTVYAITTRYRADIELISLKEANEAVAQARRIRKSIRKLLPKDVLKRRKK